MLNKVSLLKTQVIRWKSFLFLRWKKWNLMLNKVSLLENSGNKGKIPTIPLNEEMEI